MADEPKPEEEQSDGGKGGIIPWIAITLVCGGIGVAIPFLMPVTAEPPPEVVKEPAFELPKPEDTAFIPFDAVVVNLDEGQLTRYLRVAVALQVAKEDELEITTKMEEKKAVLKNWLLNQISDKDLEEIRGAAGQNRLRREIRDQFNTVLFPDGFDRIYDVLFDEYNVQ
ncbi:MAG: flagellar basal body-associated FliL family protein [Planctomycetaceae bacterium]|nr:flagellar basal body-associated FliL family protein [Planctomycetaceae bacterium]